MVDVGGILGSYNFEKRKLDGCQIFRDSTARLQQRRSGTGLTSSSSSSPLVNENFPQEKPNSPPALVQEQQHGDPLLAQLQKFKEKIEELERSARAYDSKHVNQTFRKINAECYTTQANLDRLKVDGRTDHAQKLRKQLIVRTEKAAEILGSKLHPMGPVPCTICLKLA